MALSGLLIIVSILSIIRDSTLPYRRGLSFKIKNKKNLICTSGFTDIREDLKSVLLR